MPIGVVLTITTPKIRDTFNLYITLYNDDEASDQEFYLLLPFDVGRVTPRVKKITAREWEHLLFLMKPGQLQLTVPSKPLATT